MNKVWTDEAWEDYLYWQRQDSLKRFETVFPACGSSNSAIELDNSGTGKIFQQCGLV